jgi:hypothetical protein
MDRDPVRVYDPRKQRDIVAGYVEGNIFVKEITKASHFLRIAQGYAIQETAIDICKARELKYINFRIKGENNIITLDDFLKNSPFPKNRGNGFQHEISLERIKRCLIKEAV